MNIRWQWQGLPILIAAALALAGCPGATGRHRGVGDGSSPGVCSTTPTGNGYCAVEGETCSGYVYCPAYGGANYDDCQCVGHVWSCDRCPVDYDGGFPPYDGSVPGTCPSTPVHTGDYCYSSPGLQCPGSFVVDCNNNYSREYCECRNDGFFYCSVPGCTDGGGGPTDGSITPPDVTGPGDGGSVCPDAPAAGRRCTVLGYGCWYGGDGGACRTYCNCDNTGAWACIALPCADAASD